MVVIISSSAQEQHGMGVVFVCMEEEIIHWAMSHDLLMQAVTSVNKCEPEFAYNCLRM